MCEIPTYLLKELNNRLRKCYNIDKKFEEKKLFFFFSPQLPLSSSISASLASMLFGLL